MGSKNKKKCVRGRKILPSRQKITRGTQPFIFFSSRRLTHIKRTRNGALLLNCSNHCSFAHPASYFLHSITLFTLAKVIYFFWRKSGLGKRGLLPSPRGLCHQNTTPSIFLRFPHNNSMLSVPRPGCVWLLTPQHPDILRPYPHQSTSAADPLVTGSIFSVPCHLMIAAQVSASSGYMSAFKWEPILDSVLCICSGSDLQLLRSESSVRMDSSHSIDRRSDSSSASTSAS